MSERMSEEQNKLEEMLLKHIENQVASAVSENDTVAETTLALIELWKFKGC